jgi:hypothetical protein
VRKSTIYLYGLGLVVMVVAALASTGLIVSAQNANSSMTTMNTSKPKPKKPRKPMTAMATTNGRCDPTKQEQTDLSGTYMGKADHGNGQPAQDTTLTITGNNFTMTSGSETHSGRMTAVTTCGYIGVTMMMGDLTPPPPSPNPPPPLPAVSLRAKKVGDKLWLKSVPGEKMQVSFTPTGGGAMKKPRRHKATMKKTEPAAPAKTTP